MRHFFQRVLALLGSVVSWTRHRLARLGSRSSKQLLLLLASTARGVIRRQRPFVVGVTGSVGKTSVKIAIGAVVGSTRRVRAGAKNYNNEIGFPVVIIGGAAPGRSLFVWLALLARGMWLSLVRSHAYPEALVLEYGADHPGDIATLVAIARPQIAVLTTIGAAHTEFFGSVEGVGEEKWQLIAALPSDGRAVLNTDDARVMALRPRTNARVVTFGLNERADVRGGDIRVTYGGAGGNSKNQIPNSNTNDTPVAHRTPSPIGTSFSITSTATAISVYLPGVLGAGHASAALAGAAVGVALGIPLPDIAHALERYAPPPGRMRVIPGIKGTTIIDDTYNASPLAIAVALDTLATLQMSGRRIVVFGDMLELGPLTEREHFHIGELVASRAVDYAVLVGEAMRHAAGGARQAGMPEDRVLTFARAEDAGRFVQDLLQPGDIVLVKASQGIRLERVVKELMAEPLRAKDLLCRQDAQWIQ